MNIITFLAVGIFIGWVASYLVKGESSGIILNLFIGITGAFIGGSLYQTFQIESYSFWGGIAMSTIGAVCFLLILGLFMNKRPGSMSKNKFKI